MRVKAILTDIFLLIFIVGVCGTTYGAIRQTKNDLLYEAGENFLAFGAAISAVIIVMNRAPRNISSEPSDIAIHTPQRRNQRFQLPKAILLSVLSGLTLIITDVIAAEHLSFLYLLSLSLVTGIVIALASYVIGSEADALSTSVNKEQNSELLKTMKSSLPQTPVAICLILCWLGELLLLWQVPGTTMLTGVFAPINLLLIPGLSLSLWLVPNNVSWIIRILLAPPLGLSMQLLLTLWATQLQLSIQPSLFFFITSLITLLCLFGILIQQAVRHRA